MSGLAPRLFKSSPTDFGSILPSYTRLVSGNKDKIPFLLQGAEGIKRSLFSLAELPTFTEDALSW